MDNIMEGIDRKTYTAETDKGVSGHLSERYGF